MKCMENDEYFILFIRHFPCPSPIECIHQHPIKWIHQCICTQRDITNERNVQGTDITSEKNVQILYTQNQFTVQVFTKPVYSTCIHRMCTGMEFNQQ